MIFTALIRVSNMSTLRTGNPPASNPLAMVAQSTVTSFPELGDEFASHLRRKADAELPFHSTRPSSEMLTELPFSDVTTHYEPNPPVQSASQNRPNSMSFVSKDFLEPSQTPSKKSSPAVTPKRNSILNLFFSSPGEKRERRESEMSVDTVLAGRVRRASSVLSSSTTIRGPGMTTLGVFRSELGVIADVESETEMTAVAKEGGTSRSLNNHDMAAVDVEEGVHGRSFSGGYSSTPWTLHTRSESGASLDQAGAPSPSSAAALNEQVRQLQISQEAGVPVPKAMGVSIATQTMDEPGIERATSPAISEASYARADSSLQFHNFVARPSSSTLDHPSAQSQNGYDASLSSNSFHPYQDRNSVLSNASSDAPLPAVVPISPHRRGGFGRFWNSVSPPSRQSTRVSSRASSRLKVDNPGPVRLNASPGRVTPVYDGLRSISGRPALSSTELAVLQHEFSGTDEDSGSFMTAPEGFSLHSGYSSSGSRHSESEGEGGYVTAASSMSVASGRSAGEGYVTAPEDMPGEAL
ncbi:hypothetical protein BC830DRAFT_1157598 [Chytriomyces sp. MP71]|nr:hypothetical protein BC830DRAFT_1157598 [Chytriomyces sp. MP71]